MIYRAAAAYPYQNAEQASADLRGQLRVIAIAGGGIPDWSSLVVAGPVDLTGLYGRRWFEWAATISADGGRDLTREAVDDDLRVAPTDGAAESTMPQAPII